MSALRISRPGHPTQLIPLEPASARKSGGLSSGWFSGTILTGQSGSDEHRREQLREASKRYRGKAK